MKKKINKNNEPSVQKYRLISQISFILICIWIGIEFYFFTSFLESGGNSFYVDRPAGAEGFLPISALMSIYYFVLTGVIHPVHPAGFFVLIGAILVSVIFGKSFCSWICPIGSISEYVADFSEKIMKKLFKRVLYIPRWLDYPLRSLKYLLLLFFVYAIFYSMTIYSLKMFLDSPYNAVADLKMWYFFADISQTALVVIAVLFFLSMLIRNFWCRFLCPYGALLGIISFLSPNKIRRNTDSCIDCNLCAKACPSRIKVDIVKTVLSDECSTCMSCVDACPVEDTLMLKSLVTKKKVSKKVVAFGVAVSFILVIVFAKVTGQWESNLSKEKYLEYFKQIDNLGHPRSTSEIEKLNRKAERLNSKQNKNR